MHLMNNPRQVWVHSSQVMYEIIHKYYKLYVTMYEVILYVFYNTHQLQLNHDTRAHSEAMQDTHTILWYTRNYMYYELPLCVGLHAYPPTIFTRSSILHANAYVGCDKHDTTCTSILLPRSCQSQAKLCAQLLIDILVVSTKVNC